MNIKLCHTHFPNARQSQKASSARKSSCLVNYVWIQKEGSNDKIIPPKFFAALQENAYRYPEHNFHLWIEARALIHCYTLSSNITVRFLDELEPQDLETVYKTKLFEPKIDLLRLLVLQKALTENENRAVIYADFDILDLKLESPEFKERLDAYGMAFAGCYHPAQNKNVRNYFGLFKRTETICFGKTEEIVLQDYEDKEYFSLEKSLSPFCKAKYLEYGKVLKSDFEIGFIAFNKNASSVLDQMVARAKKSACAAHDSCDPRDAVYFSIEAVLNEWSQKTNPEINWRKNVASFYVQYCSGWKLDDIDILVPEMTG